MCGLVKCRRMGRQVKVLPAEGSELPLAGGAASRLHNDARDGLTAGVLASAPAAGVKLANAALFVDQNSQQLGTVASVKWYGFGGPCPGFWGCAACLTLPSHRAAHPALWLPSPALLTTTPTLPRTDSRYFSLRSTET